MRKRNTRFAALFVLCAAAAAWLCAESPRRVPPTTRNSLNSTTTAAASRTSYSSLDPRLVGTWETKAMSVLNPSGPLVARLLKFDPSGRCAVVNRDGTERLALVETGWRIEGGKDLVLYEYERPRKLVLHSAADTLRGLPAYLSEKRRGRKELRETLRYSISAVTSEELRFRYRMSDVVWRRIE